MKADTGQFLPPLQETEEFRAQGDAVEPYFLLHGQRLERIAPPGGLLMNFNVSENLEVFHLAAIEFSRHPGFLQIKKNVQDVGCVEVALAGGVAATKFIHGKENLPFVLQAIAEGEQRKACPPVAYIQSWGGSTLGWVVKADHPSLSINDDLALPALLHSGKEGRDDHLARHKERENLQSRHVLSLPT